LRSMTAALRSGHRPQVHVGRVRTTLADAPKRTPMARTYREGPPQDQTCGRTNGGRCDGGLEPPEGVDMTSAAPPVVSTAADFCRHVRDGDILLFDKLASLNRLVQWGDNRPVGHCGVWFGDGVYEATRKDAAVSGVFHTPLEELLGLRVRDRRGDSVNLVRTVTAMRHEDISADHLGLIRQFLEDHSGVDFAVQEMVLLTPFAVQRAHGDDVASIQLVDALVRVSKLYARTALRGRGGDYRMFCSELVYRSFAHAGLSIEIVDPLFERFPSGSGDGRRGDGGRGDDGMPETLDDVLEDYRDFFEDTVTADPLPEEVWAVEAAGDGRRGGPDGRRGWLRPTGPRREMELADMVTPGDFWSSPSLEAVAVLHRPPGH
jgi:hypothetical protein